MENNMEERIAQATKELEEKYPFIKDGVICENDGTIPCDKGPCEECWYFWRSKTIIGDENETLAHQTNQQ